MKKFDLSKVRTNDELYEAYTEARQNLAQKIRRDVKCTDYLTKARKTGYICEFCKSGTKNEGTGAVMYYKDTNTCTCHACKKSFDVLDLIQEKNGCDYNRALEIGAGILGIDMPKYGEDNARSANQSRAQAVESIVEPAAGKTSTAEEKPQKTADFTEYYDVCAKRIDDPAAISYLTSRGISLETAKEYNIGFDPAADPASAPGAIMPTYKPHPTPRIITPCSKSHYVARSIDPNADYKALNPSKKKGGGPVYLFNADAIDSMADVIFIQEGIFDALSLLEVGEEAIALNSKDNSKTLIELLKEHPAEYYPVFVIVPDNDGDATTNKDTQEKAAELCKNLQELGYISIVYNLAGDYHDTNDFIIADRKAFEAAVDKARAAALRPENTPQEPSAPAPESTETTTPEEIPTDEGKTVTEPENCPLKGLLSFDDVINEFTTADDSFITLKAFPNFSATAKIKKNSSVIIAADTGAGKSSLALNFLNDLNENYPCIYFNLEMDRLTVLRRLVSIHSGIELDVIEGYKNDDSTAAAVNTHVQKIVNRKPLQIVQDAYSLKEIENIIVTSTKDRQETTIVFIDHSLLLDIDGHTTGRYDRFTQVSEELRKIALRYNIVLFILLQQSRAGKSDENEKPKNSSLKESGSWENDATHICFLWYDPADKRKKLLLTKNRTGEQGEFTLSYWKKTQTYTEQKGQDTAPVLHLPSEKKSHREKQREKLQDAYNRAIIATKGAPTLHAIAEAADVTTATVKTWIKEYGGCMIDGVQIEPAGIDTAVEVNGFIKLTPTDDNAFEEEEPEIWDGKIIRRNKR